MEKPPTFHTIKEAAEWAEAHDTALYFDQMEDVPPFDAERPAKRTVWLPVQVEESQLDTIKELAKKRRMDFHDLAGELLTESLAISR
jgi:hypothetical protein